MQYGIYNCHIHTFTAENFLPNNFLTRALVRIMRIEWLRKILLWLVGRVLLRMNRDGVRLAGRFLARGAFESQEKIFEFVQRQYPVDPAATRFIVLPLDFDQFTSFGKPIRDYETQLKDLAQLRDKHPTAVIPFCAVDPFRDNVVEDFMRWHRDYKIKGLKIYPIHGFSPAHPTLLEIYKYCQDNKLPVITHCSPGGLKKPRIPTKKAIEFAHPRNYADILTEFPRLNICLAHFGGAQEWERHIKGEAPRSGDDATWLSVILDMIRATKRDSAEKKYPNLFTDISYTMFVEMPHYRPFNYFNFLNVLLENKDVREHVLFGTDYYMVEREKVSEKEVSIGLRAHLGEALYFQIAYHNPKRFLYESDT